MTDRASTSGWRALIAAFSERDQALKCSAVAELATPTGAWPPSLGNQPTVEQPGRPAAPVLVPARDVPRRRLGTEAGRAALLHAIAHIEFSAINLALDAVLRFPEMSEEYRADWLSVARDEARHFTMLADRMQSLGMTYGDLPAHDGLWQAAVLTADDVLARMAVVPRVLEARGLDVTPGMIARLKSAGDTESADILETILEEEVRHVWLGSKWFRRICQSRRIDPKQTFLQCLEDYLPGHSYHGLNEPARKAAGFLDSELTGLRAISPARA